MLLKEFDTVGLRNKMAKGEIVVVLDKEYMCTYHNFIVLEELYRKQSIWNLRLFTML